MQNFEYIPLAALNQYAYCPHRWWRMFCAGEFGQNHYTIEGTDLHRRVHSVGEENREEVWQVRGIWLKSERYRLIGKADLIELESGEVFPVEYKRGNRGEWENDALQVCAQGLCLEEMMGQAIAQGFMYYAQSRRRQVVEFSQSLRQTAIATIQEISTLLNTGEMPPAIYGPRCRGCSLYRHCLPQVTKKMKRYKEAI